MDNRYSVYVKTTDAGYISEINSSGFIRDPENWIKIDEGEGDRFHHAQNYYLEKPARTEAGAMRYKLIGSVATECSAEDIDAQEAALAAQNPGSANYDNVWDELDAAYQEGVDSV